MRHDISPGLLTQCSCAASWFKTRDNNTRQSIFSDESFLWQIVQAISFLINNVTFSRYAKREADLSVPRTSGLSNLPHCPPMRANSIETHRHSGDHCLLIHRSSGPNVHTLDARQILDGTTYDNHKVDPRGGRACIEEDGFLCYCCRAIRQR